MEEPFPEHVLTIPPPPPFPTNEALVLPLLTLPSLKPVFSGDIAGPTRRRGGVDEEGGVGGAKRLLATRLIGEDVGEGKEGREKAVSLPVVDLASMVSR